MRRTVFGPFPREANNTSCTPRQTSQGLVRRRGEEAGYAEETMRREWGEELKRTTNRGGSRGAYFARAVSSLGLALNFEAINALQF